MSIYIAHFRTAAEYAEREFKARTPKQALKLALELWEHAAELLTFESYDKMMPLEEIEISGDAGSELAMWQSADIRLRDAAMELLALLKIAVATSDPAKHKWIAEARAVIAEAEGAALDDTRPLA